MGLAEATVHTSGINIESVLTIIGALVVAIVAVGTWLDQRVKNRQDATKAEISEAVTHLSEVLLERLETKENVANLRTQVATLSVQVDGLVRTLDRIKPS